MNYAHLTIPPSFSILDALKKMDIARSKLLIVTLENRFVGLISIGDLQRAIIADVPMDTEILNILRLNVRVGHPEDSLEMIRATMLEHRMEFCPIVSKTKEIQRVYFWADLFGNNERQYYRQFSLPVVIMAGGFGSRLRPLTNVLPKPLVPIGDRTMLENIFERFANHGCSRFLISVNYKAELIEFYLKSLDLSFDIKLFKESKPMGTAGSLSMMTGEISQRFIVTNCDILIDEDYSEIIDYHVNNQNEITVVSVLKSYDIPYGTLRTGKGGILKELHEKPNLGFKINSGMYIVEPHLLREVKNDSQYHITHLIQNVLDRSGRVGVFPVSEDSWTDMGTWPEYIRAINKHAISTL